MRNLKKVIALVAVFAMMVSTVAFAQTFTDVAATDTYAEAIETLNALDIITGDDEDGDGNMDFRPEDTITRAEVSAIISRIQGMKEAAKTATSFADVPADHWASGFIAQAEGQGIVNGYGDGNFGPEDAVKYEEAVKMIMETIGYYAFAIENGGYPAGYTLAAQRYGVLDGVVGGANGEPAPRGMVAQMICNAIDTPIMDRTTWGNNGGYIIYDDFEGYYGFETLLTRDLDMIKLTGMVVANSYTDIDGGVVVDNKGAETLMLGVANTESNYQYLATDKYFPKKNGDWGVYFGAKEDLYQGDIEADSYLGLPVTVYASYEATDEWELQSITTSARANAEVITFDQYAGIDVSANDYRLKYVKDANSRASLTGKIDENAKVIYNGIGQNIADKTKFFGDAKNDDALINPETDYSGQITLIKTGVRANYDVVIIDLAVSAVVDEVDARGNVLFKDSIEVPYINDNNNVTKSALSKLAFEKDDDEYIVTLSQNGKIFDYKELKDWDVLSIIWAAEADCDVYDAVVLGADNYVDAIVTSTSDDEYRIEDKWYKAVESVQDMNLQAGDSGRFYIDNYGKIVAWDKTVEVEGAVANRGNYAYILNAQYEKNSWGASALRIAALDKTGEIYEAYLATSSVLYNYDGKDKVSVKLSDSDKFDKEFVNDLADALINTVITYTANTAGDIKTITFPTEDDTDKFYWNAKTEYGQYDAEDKELGDYTIGEDTYVFLVDANDYNDETPADEEKVTVMQGYALDNEVYYDYVAFDVDGQDVPGAIVVLGYDFSAYRSTDIAVINRVGEVFDGTNDTLEVSFFMSGEEFVATVNRDRAYKYYDELSDANRGDIWKLNVANDVIVGAAPILVFDNVAEKAFAEDPDELPEFTLEALVNDSIQDMYFGAAVEKKSAGFAIELGSFDKGIVTFDGGSYTVKDNDKPNVYVYDPNLRGNSQLYVGSLNEVTVDEKLFDTKKYDDVDVDEFGTVDVPAYGMADYIYVREYDDDVADIVIYKNFEFDYDINRK